MTKDEPEQTRLYHRPRKHPVYTRERRSWVKKWISCGTKWTCQFWCPEDRFGTHEMILRPKGIVEGQRERGTTIVLGKLAWLGGGQPADVGASIALVPWTTMAVHGKVVRTKRGFASSGFFAATVDCLANSQTTRSHSPGRVMIAAHLNGRDCFELDRRSQRVSHRQPLH